MKPIILGESPNANGDRYYMFPLSGPIGQRLCTLAGITPESKGTQYGKYYWPLMRRFELWNLLERYSGPDVPVVASLLTEAWGALAPQLSGRVVVLLGRRLAGLAGVEDFFVWRKEGGARLVAIPHPSALSGYYNSTEMWDSAAHTLQDALALATETSVSG